MSSTIGNAPTCVSRAQVGIDGGLRQAAIDPLFAELGVELPVLIQEAQERQKSLPAIKPLDGPFPVDDQRRIGERLMKPVGFDFDQGASM